MKREGSGATGGPGAQRPADDNSSTSSGESLANANFTSASEIYWEPAVLVAWYLNPLPPPRETCFAVLLKLDVSSERKEKTTSPCLGVYEEELRLYLGFLRCAHQYHDVVVVSADSSSDDEGNMPQERPQSESFLSSSHPATASRLTLIGPAMAGFA